MVKKAKEIQKTSIDVNEVLANVERWISEYDEKVKANYKLVNPEAKSIKLTYSKNFDDLLKEMMKDTKECKLLNALKADSSMRLKSSYLADNNINALSLAKDKEGTSVISYTDLRSDLVKDLGFLKTWTKRGQLINDCRGNVKTLERNFPTIYDVLKNTPEHRMAIFTDREINTQISETISNLRMSNRTIESNVVSNPTREKFPNREYNRIAPFFTYLSFQQQGSWEVERIAKFIQRSLANIHRLFNEDAGNTYIGKDWNKVGTDFKEHFLDTNIIYAVLEDVICYFDYSLTSMADLLESLKDTKMKVEDFLIKLEDRNKILIQNFLSVIRSTALFAKTLLDMEHKGIKYDTINGSRSISKTLKNASILGMDFDLAMISLNLTKHFEHIGRYGSGNIEYYLNGAYTAYLKNLYSSQFRITCSPGKIANKLFNGHYTAVEVEEFTTLFKKHTTAKESTYGVKIVEGALIAHYYNENMYSIKKEERKMTMLEAERRALDALHGRIHRPADNVEEVVELNNGMDAINRGGGSLWQSCMKYARCYNQIQTYSLNPRTIKLLVVLDNEGKLAARAVLWYHENGNIYLDRVYAMNEKARIDLFNWAEARKFINIYYGNAAYSKELTFSTNGNNGLLFTVDHAIDSIPYFDTARRVDNRGIIALGQYSNNDISKANKKIDDMHEMNAKIATPAPNIEEISLIQLSTLNIDSFRKKAVKKKYDLSQKYSFALRTSVKRKSDVAPRYTWMDLGGNRKRVLSSEYDMTLDFVNKIVEVKKVAEPVAITMTPRVINKKQLEEWKAERANRLISTMQFLGASNYTTAKAA